MSAGLLLSALVAYALGTLLMLLSLLHRKSITGAPAVAFLSVGLLLNGAALVLTALRLHRLPVVDVRSALPFFAFNATLAFIVLYRRYPHAWFGALIFPFIFLLTLAAELNPAHALILSRLSEGWLLVHSLAMILGYTGFFLTFVAAVLYLMRERLLKAKQANAFYEHLPSLDVCDRLYDRSLVFGLIFLSTGIVTGCLWASHAWSGDRELDPKILATAFTWLVYLLLCSTRFSVSWRERRSAYAAIFGVVAMMATFQGVSFLSSQHGYFPTIRSAH